MIPKIIHYCWLSDDPYPEKIQHCIDSWKRVLPDYEFILWDRKRFDLESMIWCKQAYDCKKYAFASDYIRMYAVYNYGGIYLDSDVEVLKSFNDLLDLPYFICDEVYQGYVEVAAFGAEKGTKWVGECMHFYDGRKYVEDDKHVNGITAPEVANDMFQSNHSIKKITDRSEFDNDPSVVNLFPYDWFCARRVADDSSIAYAVTDKTYCVHHFANSWVSQSGVVKSRLKTLLVKCGLMQWGSSDPLYAIKKLFK